MQFRLPFNYDVDITSRYGMRGGRLHGGVDFGLPQGTPIVASQAGIIISIATDQYGGAYIDIEHSRNWWTRYLHLSKFLVKRGQKVKTGDVIGLSGGRPSTWGAGDSSGEHLHFEVHNPQRNKTLDPLKYIFFMDYT